MCGFPGTVTVTIILILMYCAVTQISIESFYLFFMSLFCFSDPTYKSIKWQPKAAVWYFVSLFIFVFMFSVVNIKKILDFGWTHNLLRVREASQFKHIKKSTVQLDPMGQLVVVLVAAFSWMICVITQTSTDKWGEEVKNPNQESFSPNFSNCFIISLYIIYNLFIYYLSVNFCTDTSFKWQ